jgi:ribokinase
MQVGEDGHANLVKEALASAGVNLDHLNAVKGPTGHALVMLQPGGRNSIIIVGGANASWPRLDDGIGQLSANVQQLIRQAGAVLLQREVPDTVNLEAAKIARIAKVPVIMDAGGAEGPIPEELLKFVTVLSPNETELARLTGMPTKSLEDVIDAAAKIQEMGVKQVLVKMGEHGSVLVREDGPPLMQAAILAPVVVDTTGAGDTFTAAYAVALIEHQSPIEALRFAAAAASLCVRSKGTIPSMPKRKAVMQLLADHPIVLE